MAKKKLDELFQEKFKDFEQTPDDKVWRAIEASLDKKKRRVIPLWWKLGGVAAVLVIGLLVINPFANSTKGDIIISDIENKTNDSLEQNDPKKNENIGTPDAKETQLTDTNYEDTGKNDSASDSDYPSKNITSNPKNDLKFAPVREGKKESQLTSSKKEKPKEIKSNEIVPQLNTGIAKVLDSTLKKDIGQKNNIQHLNKKIHEELVQQDTIQKSFKNPSAEEVVEQQKGSLSPKKDDLKGKIENTGIAQNLEKQNPTMTNDDTIEEDKKKSIFDEIKEQKVDEEVAEVDAPKKRWSLGPSIAPVYFDAFGEGSPVNPIFVSNTKSGETNLSYGLSVAYEINDRLSVRSGLHKVDYGYETGDIEFGSSLDGAVSEQLSNIDYASTASDLVVRSKVGGTTVSANENAFDPALDVNSENLSTSRDGVMTQQFGYLEVPLELNYTLLDSKIGVNLIGGLSSLFLIDNAVSLTSGNETTQIGEANNVNNINFSTNIGLGIDYNFTSKIKLNVEPIFKYQLNTFNQVDGTFNPFSVGVYSGLTFKF